MSDTTGPGPEEPRTWTADPAEQAAAHPAAGGADEGDRPREAGRPDEAAQREGAGRPEAPGEAVPEGAAPPEDSAARIAELEDRWRRALADLDNYRKRMVGVVERERGEERARTAAAWLPVIDDLERALEHADAEPDAVIQGVRSVLDHARQVIQRLGYPRRDDEGEPFDPARHEAISTVADSGAADGTVVLVVRPAYGQGSAQLRPAQVVVAKGHTDGPAP